jgi:hypothetical protein
LNTKPPYTKHPISFLFFYCIKQFYSVECLVKNEMFRFSDGWRATKFLWPSEAEEQCVRIQLTLSFKMFAHQTIVLLESICVKNLSRAVRVLNLQFQFILFVSCNMLRLISCNDMLKLVLPTRAAFHLNGVVFGQIMGLFSWAICSISKHCWSEELIIWEGSLWRIIILNCFLFVYLISNCWFTLLLVIQQQW